MKLNTIYNMDCAEGMKSLEDESVDAIVTDPPFGIGFRYKTKEKFNDPHEYWNWLSPIYEDMLRILKPGGFCAIWQAQKHFKYLWEWFGDDIHIYVSAKNFAQIRGAVPIDIGYEPVVVKYKAGAKPLRPKVQYRSYDYFVANTAKFVAETNSLAGEHPCPRPIDQVEELIRNFVVEDGIVLDPFLGSGTTAVICKKLGRSYLGFEIDKEYYELSQKRLKKVKKQGNLGEYLDGAV